MPKRRSTRRAVASANHQKEVTIKDLPAAVINQISSHLSIREVLDLQSTCHFFLRYNPRRWGNLISRLESCMKPPSNLMHENAYFYVVAQDNRLFTNTLGEHIYARQPFSEPVQDYQFFDSYHSSYVLTLTGKLFVWGANDYGQVGNGKASLACRPEEIKLPLLDDETIKQFKMIRKTSFAITSHSRLFAWGNNELGLLGIGSTEVCYEIPSLVNLPLRPNEAIKHFKLTNRTCLLITTANTVFMWGNNTFGQVAAQDQDTQSTPHHVNLPLSPNEAIRDFVFEDASVFILTTTNRIFTWGCNLFGELGIGNFEHQTLPQEINLPLQAGEGIKKFHVHDQSIFVISTANRLLAWGHNHHGQLGNGNFDDQPAPQAIDLHLHFGETIELFEVIAQTVFIFTSMGKLITWGKNHIGLQNNNVMFPDQPTPRTIDLHLNVDERVHHFLSKESTAAALTTHNRLFMWGLNHSGQLGNGDFQTNSIPHEVDLPLKPGEAIKQFELNDTSASVLTTNGRLIMWGRNRCGQLGNGDSLEQTTPQVIQLPLQANESVHIFKLMNETSIALTSNGRLIMWGDNSFGQLGNGNTSKQCTPRAVTLSLRPNETIVDFYFLDFTMFAITSTGRIAAWGKMSEHLFPNRRISAVLSFFNRNPYALPTFFTSFTKRSDGLRDTIDRLTK